MEYEFIYKLKPIKEVEPGWWKLRWKPIKNGTYNIFITKEMISYSHHFIGIRFYEVNAHNGWHRSWDGRAFEIGLLFFTIHMWIIWNIVVHEDGPSDVRERKPLNLTKARRQ